MRKIFFLNFGIYFEIKTSEISLTRRKQRQVMISRILENAFVIFFIPTHVLFVVRIKILIWKAFQKK